MLPADRLIGITYAADALLMPAPALERYLLEKGSQQPSKFLTYSQVVGLINLVVTPNRQYWSYNKLGVPDSQIPTRVIKCFGTGVEEPREKKIVEKIKPAFGRIKPKQKRKRRQTEKRIETKPPSKPAPKIVIKKRKCRGRGRGGGAKQGAFMPVGDCLYREPLHDYERLSLDPK